MGVLEKRITVVYGHYGVGKTNLSLNLAINQAKDGEKVTLIDLDIANPYFRSSDYRDILSKYNIKIFGPNFGNSNSDTPSLPQIGSAIEDGERIIIDAGGDDVGATVLRAYSKIINAEDYDALYVINKYRSLAGTPESCVILLKEIEQASSIKATGIVNNSHLKNDTTYDTIVSSISYAEKVCELSSLRLKFNTVPFGLNKIDRMYPVDVYVRTPWEME